MGTSLRAKLILPRVGKEIGVDPTVILATSHGRRSIDVLQIYAPELANWACKLHQSVMSKRETNALS